MIRMENLLLSVPTDEDLRRAYYEDTQAFLQRQRARIQVGQGVGVLCVGGCVGGGAGLGWCGEYVDSHDDTVHVTLMTGPEGPARGALRPMGLPLGR